MIGQGRRSEAVGERRERKTETKKNLRGGENKVGCVEGGGRKPERSKKKNLNWDWSCVYKARDWKNRSGKPKMNDGRGHIKPLKKDG